MATASIQLDGLPLTVEYRYCSSQNEIEVEEITLDGWEILSIMDDRKIALARERVLKGMNNGQDEP